MNASPHYDRDVLVGGKFHPISRIELHITSRGDLTLDEIEEAEVLARWAESRDQAANDIHAWWMSLVWVVFGVAFLLLLVLFGEASEASAAAFAFIPGLRGCSGGCKQGRKSCDCAGTLDRVDSSSLDVGLLIASGAMEPPKVRQSVKPMTVSVMTRLRRWWERNVIGGPACGDLYR